MFEKRIKKLLENIGDDEAVLVTNGNNCFYFSGIRSSNIYLIITKNKRYLITDFRYEYAAKKNTADFKVLIDKSVFYYIKEIIGNTTVYTELEHISYEFYKKLDENISGEIKPIGKIIENIRAVKDDIEVENIKKAQEISDKAFLDTLKFIKEGITEKELKCELEYRMAKYGGEKPSFDTIVLFNKNSALPHGESGNTKLKNKDIILIDFGCYFNGYASDNTRTFFLGSPDDEMKKAYDAVLSAHIMARDFIKINIEASLADKLARDFLDDSGYKNLFGHSLGHGVGLDIHENVRLSPKSDNILTKNMIFSIEPGVYLENKFGIRIEDIYVLKEKGVISLTNLSKDLLVL